MKILSSVALVLVFAVCGLSQNPAQAIYDAERAFEKSVAEKGINAGFLDFVTPDATCFAPGAPTNCVEFYKNAPPSKASLTWNATYIDVSSNGAMAYSTGNSVYRAGGKDDPNASFGEYATIWMRRPDGSYKVAFDIGLSHPEQNNETKWASPGDLGKEPNTARSSAADYANAFFEKASKSSLADAYKTYLATDSRLVREGKMPIVGREEALREAKKEKARLVFNTRSVFVQAADLAYVTNKYQLGDKNGFLVGNGYFLQVWKLREGRWQIVFDLWMPTPLVKK